jgi:hypothetical protein
MISDVKLITGRWQCRFGRHVWERCTDPRRDAWRSTYLRCFPCGKEKNLK